MPESDSEGPLCGRDSGTSGMFKEPEIDTITEDELINEVRMIYAGLVMVEKKCIEVDRRQTESKADLSGSQPYGKP